MAPTVPVSIFLYSHAELTKSMIREVAIVKDSRHMPRFYVFKRG
jgi:hypothetical protein